MWFNDGTSIATTARSGGGPEGCKRRSTVGLEAASDAPIRAARLTGYRYSSIVVSCAPSSATNTAINSAGSVVLALAETM